MDRARRRPPEAGFGLTELLVVVALIGIVSGMAVLVTPIALPGMRADGSTAQLTSLLKRAKERAVSERRDMSMVIASPREVQIFRLATTAGGAPTLVDSVVLENNMRVSLTPGLPDTPDGFGNAAAADFGLANSMIFRAEGVFTDEDDNLDPLNGTIFLSIRNEPLTARAVTIFGPTALISSFRWDGVRWID